MNINIKGPFVLLINEFIEILSNAFLFDELKLNTKIYKWPSNSLTLGRK